MTAEFINDICNATLDSLSLGLSDESINQLQHPTHEQPGHSNNNDLCTAIKLFLGNPLETTYEINHAIILDHVSGANTHLL